MPKTTDKLKEPELHNHSDQKGTNWQQELSVLLRYVSILVVVAINKIKEKD